MLILILGIAGAVVLLCCCTCVLVISRAHRKRGAVQLLNTLPVSGPAGNKSTGYQQAVHARPLTAVARGQGPPPTGSIELQPQDGVASRE